MANKPISRPRSCGERPSKANDGSWSPFAALRVRATSSSASELRAHCAERLAGYKVPKAFEMAEQLPRTASGKLLRRNLT